MLKHNSVVSLTREEGKSFWFLGTLMTLKASTEGTNAAFSMIEQVAPAGFAPPVHVHHAEDEAFYIIEGEATYFVGDETIHAPSGAYVYLPRDVPHSFLINGSSPARLLQWTFPAGLEKFFVELGMPTNELVLPPPVSPEMVQQGIKMLLELAPKYHLDIIGPPPGAETH